MRIFFLGDFKSNTGPAIANKAIRKGLLGKKNIYYSDANNKVARFLEMVLKIFLSDGVCFCSFSKVNKFGIRIANLLNKKTFYLMHGYSTFENTVNNDSINQSEITKINNFEKYIFRNVNQIFCVSEAFMKYMIEIEPEFKDKFNYNYNGLDLKVIRKNTKEYSNNNQYNQIVSIGGGMKLKNNLVVCEAINKLNEEKKMKLKYIVIGPSYTDKEKICSYDFVTYYDSLPHTKVLEILSESYLYIQNSVFETFGLALLEALYSNCNLLVSSKVGAIGVIKTITDKDLIYEQNNIKEISEKIEEILILGNNKRLRLGVIEDEIELQKSAESLVNKIQKVMVKNKHKGAIR